MAIKFGGEFEVQRKPDDVYDFLTDPKKFAPLLPDFQGMTQQDDTHFVVKVTVGISYIKGTAEVKMQLAEAERPKRALYKGQGTVAGGNVSLTAGFFFLAFGKGAKGGREGGDPGCCGAEFGAGGELLALRRGEGQDEI